MRIETGIDGAQGGNAAEHHAGPHQQYDGEGDLADDERAPGAQADCAVVAAAFLEHFVEIGAAAAQRRQRAGEHAGGHGHRGDEQQDPSVDRNLVGARHLTGQHRLPHRQSGAGQQQPERAAAGRENERLAQQLLDDAPAARPERGPDGNLLAAAGGAREQQIADVGAGNQQDQDHRRQQHHQRRPHVADDQLLQRDDGRAPAGV